MKLDPGQRTPFTVFLLFQDPEIAASLRTFLAKSGYTCFVFIDYDVCLDRIQAEAPHLILFDMEVLMGTLSQFVQESLERHPDAHFLPMVSDQEVEALEPYKDYNFVGALHPGPQMEERSLWLIDLYFSGVLAQRKAEHSEADRNLGKAEALRFQDQLKAMEQEKAKLLKEIEEGKTRVLDPDWRASEAQKVYSQLGTRDELISRLMDRALAGSADSENNGCLFFRYLPTLFNLVATQGRGISLEKLKGIGVKLTPLEAELFPSTVEKFQAPSPLQDLLRQGFMVSDYLLRPLKTHRGIEGVFVFWKGANLDVHKIDNEWTVFNQTYQFLDLKQKYDAINVVDPITEAHNREFYLKTLDIEVSRARRLEKAVSIVKLSFDQWSELRSQVGDLVREAVMRTLVSIIKKTGRTNDFVCLTKDGELTLILPHSGRQGAAVRAERLRRIVEAQSFQYVESPLTISCGVSEYPTFCSSAVELDQSALQAMEYIRARGGNKLCLYKPPESFKPDFSVPPM